MQGASRIVDGQWPYADFGWAYGPGHRCSSRGFRALRPVGGVAAAARVAADAIAVLAVWWLVRREAGERWALAGGWPPRSRSRSRRPRTRSPVALRCALGRARCERAAARGPPDCWSSPGVLAPRHRLIAGLAVVAALLIGEGGARLARPQEAVPPARPARPAVGASRVARGRGGRSRGAILLLLPFAVAAGPGRLFDALVLIAARDGDLWRLPFPFALRRPAARGPPSASPRTCKDVLGFYLSALGARAGRRRDRRPRLRLRRRPSPELGGGSCWPRLRVVYLLGRADDLHPQPLVVAVRGDPRPLSRASPRPLSVGLAVVLALIALAGAANRLSACAAPRTGSPSTSPACPGSGSRRPRRGRCRGWCARPASGPARRADLRRPPRGTSSRSPIR